jgi:dihydrofolate reductase
VAGAPPGQPGTPEVVYYVAASLDALIATPDGSVGWLAPFESGDEDYGYSAFYASVDAVLLGSRTYQQSRAFASWPYPGKPCWVFSRRPLDVTEPAVTVTGEAPGRVLSELGRRGVRRAWLVESTAFRGGVMQLRYVPAPATAGPSGAQGADPQRASGPRGSLGSA